MANRNTMMRRLIQGAEQERAGRVARALAPPQPWQPIETAPRDGTLIDLRFDPAREGREGAEFYAPGSTRRKEPAEPVIENVVFCNGHFRPVVDAEAAAAAKAAMAAGDGHKSLPGTLYAIMSVVPTHWRPAAYPF